MSESVTIARPYARAAFEFALEKGEIDKWQMMLCLSSELVKQNKIKDMLYHTTSISKKRELFLSFLDDSIDQYFKNFICLMLENERLTLLPSVYCLFEFYLNEKNKVKQLEVISAAPLSEQNKEKIKVKMQQQFGSKIELICSINPELMGGFLIKSDDFLIDSTTKGILNRLHNELQA